MAAVFGLEQTMANAEGDAGLVVREVVAGNRVKVVAVTRARPPSVLNLG